MLFRQCLINEVQHLIQDYIHNLSSPFDSFLEEHILNSTFYVILDELTEAGYYAVHQNQLLTQFHIQPMYLKHGIGMFTNEAYRKQGIRRSIILGLKQWCYEHELKPICGCWYYNEASKSTLESAGVNTKIRLLNITVNRE